MSLKIRVAFCAVVFVLWLGAACFGVELYAVYRLNWVEKNNPFVLQYDQSLIWPDLDADLKPVPFPPIEVHAAKPVVDDENDNLGSLFASLSEEDRATYAQLREVAVEIYGHDGQRQAKYGPDDVASTVENAGNTIAPLIQHVFNTGKCESASFEMQRDDGPLTVDYECCPIRDATGKVDSVVCSLRPVFGLTLTEQQTRKAQFANHPMWKTPWFEYRKNACAGDRWSTNNVGFRDNFVALPKPAGVYRVCCIGGSTTDEGYTNDVTYPKHLERCIRAAMPDRGIEVLNCGVIGLDSLLEKRRALDYTRLEPDLVIEYGAVNDICHALLPMWAKDAKPWQKRLRVSKFLCQNFNGLFWPDEKAMADQFDRTVMQNLKTISEVMSRHKIKMAICSFACPDLGSLSRDEVDYFGWNVRTYWQGEFATYATYYRLVQLYNQRLKNLCEQNGILYIPLGEQFKGGIDCFGDICHMRPKGIEKKAGIICEWLKGYLKSN